MPKIHAAGALRCTTGGWEVIDDATHDPYNILSVSGSGEKLVVSYPPVVTVLFGDAHVDETFVKNRIEAGASVGLANTVIQFGRTDTAPGSFLQVNTLSIAYSNVWFHIMCHDSCTSCL